MWKCILRFRHKRKLKISREKKSRISMNKKTHQYQVMVRKKNERPWRSCEKFAFEYAMK